MQTFLLFNWFVSTYTHLTLRRVKCRSTYPISISYNKRGVNAYWICRWLPQSLHTDVKRKVVQGNDRKVVPWEKDYGSIINTEILSCRELSLIQVCSLHQATGKLCPCFTVHPISDPSACSSDLSELRLLFSCGGGGCSEPALQKGVGAKRQGSSPGLPQHPPLLGSAWWSLREILHDSLACHICWETWSSSLSQPCCQSQHCFWFSWLLVRVLPGCSGDFSVLLAMVRGRVILRNGVSSYSWFFVAFLIAVTQVSSNMEEDKLSVMSATGSTVVIDCDLMHNYIHWYKFQEGAVPRRLLYYDVSYTKVVLEPGISQGKYHVYKGTGKGYTILISGLQESDSGTYYCAFWEKHIGLDFL